MDKQTLSFQAEVKQILHLVTPTRCTRTRRSSCASWSRTHRRPCDQAALRGAEHAALFEDCTEPRGACRPSTRKRRLSPSPTTASACRPMKRWRTWARSRKSGNARVSWPRLEGDQKKDAQLIGPVRRGLPTAASSVARSHHGSNRAAAGLPPEQGRAAGVPKGAGDFDGRDDPRGPPRGTKRDACNLREGGRRIPSARGKLKAIIGQNTPTTSRCPS